MNIQKNKIYWEKIAKIYHANVGEKGDIRHEIIINPVVFEFLGDLTGKNSKTTGLMIISCLISPFSPTFV